MRLRHISLPGFTPYATASRLQTLLVSQHLSSLHPSNSSTPPPPSPPTIITLQHTPTYTTGRRQAALSPTTLSSLLAPLRIPGTPSLPVPEYHPSTRGGLVTYHGPGQLTVYPIISLRAHGLSVRGYISLLEEVVVKTLMAFGVESRNDRVNPGVWVDGASPQNAEAMSGRSPEGDAGPRKLASVGVHIRRGIASQGIGINVRSEVERGFERIEACGIEGVRIGWLEAEMRRHGHSRQEAGIEEGELMTQVENRLVNEMASGLDGIEGVESVEPELPP